MYVQGKITIVFICTYTYIGGEYLQSVYIGMKHKTEGSQLGV